MLVLCQKLHICAYNRQIFLGDRPPFRDLCPLLLSPQLQVLEPPLDRWVSLMNWPIGWFVIYSADTAERHLRHMQHTTVMSDVHTPLSFARLFQQLFQQQLSDLLPPIPLLVPVLLLLLWYAAYAEWLSRIHINSNCTPAQVSLYSTIQQCLRVCE